MKKRKVAFFDVDGTLTQGNVWRAIMDQFKKRKIRRTTNALYWLYHAPSYFLFKASLISQSRFRRGWAKHLAWYFRGYDEPRAEAIWDGVLNDHLPSQWRQDSIKILKRHKESGDLVVLVSGGPTPLIQRIAHHLGADMGVGTDLIKEGGLFTGKSGEVCQDENKELLSKIALQQKGLNVDFAGSVAYADSSADVAMFEMVGRAVALHPDEYLLPIAKERGWEIIP